MDLLYLLGLLLLALLAFCLLIYFFNTDSSASNASMAATSASCVDRGAIEVSPISDALQARLAASSRGHLASRGSSLTHQGLPGKVVMSSQW